MSLELRHLRYFIAVAEDLHFSRAAERLGISQPPLSQQIHTLEEMLGARLLVRTNRRVALTDAGEAFLKEARAILVQVDRAVDYVRSVERGEKGELHIGMTRSAMLAKQVPRAIFRFRTEFPSVHLGLEELNSLEQIDALIHEKIQVGIMRVQHLPAMLQSHMLYADPLVAVLPAKHPFRPISPTLSVPLDPAQLVHEQFIIFADSAGTGIRNQFFQICHDAGFNPRIVQEVQEASTMIGLVAAGLGITILPVSYSYLQQDSVCYIPLSSPSARSDIHVVYRCRDHSPLLRQLLTILKSEAAAHAVSRR